MISPSDCRYLLRNALSSLTVSLRFLEYRNAMARQGVRIHGKSAICGGGGISFGADTCVHRGSTITAGYLAYGEHLDSVPAGRVRIGRRCDILPGVIMATYGGTIDIGDDVSVNPGTIIYGGGGVCIGNKTRIAAYCVIVPSNHVFSELARPIMEQGVSCRGISIGTDVWIGTGVCVLDGVVVGDGAVLGAGSVVTHDVPPNSVFAGVPARLIGHRGGSSSRPLVFSV